MKRDDNGPVTTLLRGRGGSVAGHLRLLLCLQVGHGHSQHVTDLSGVKCEQGQGQSAHYPPADEVNTGGVEISLSFRQFVRRDKVALAICPPADKVNARGVGITHLVDWKAMNGDHC